MKTTFNDFIGESSSTKEVVLQNKMNRNTIITIIVDGVEVSRYRANGERTEVL